MAKALLKRDRRGTKPVGLSNACHRDFFTIPLEASVVEAIDKVRRHGKRGNIFYLYVVDEKQLLKGIVSIRNLLVASDRAKISDVYSKGVVSLLQDAPITEAYRLFSQSHFLSLPVVDPEGKIRGVLHAHELIEEYGKETEDLFEERTRGQLFELLGIQAEDASSGLTRIASGRLPWLLVNILGGAFSAFFIHAIGGRIRGAVDFLAFLPILLVVSESIGMQTASVILSLLHRASWRGVARAAVKEMGVALVLGVCCGLLVGTGVFLWKADVVIALAVGVTILLGTLYVSALGCALPYLIHRLHVDPSIAAGPLVLATADCGTLLLYLAIALFFSH